MPADPESVPSDGLHTARAVADHERSPDAEGMLEHALRRMADLAAALMAAEDIPSLACAAAPALHSFCGADARVSFDPDVPAPPGALPLRGADGAALGWLVADGAAACVPAEAMAGLLAAAAENVRCRTVLAHDAARFADFAEVASDWLWETDAQHRFCAFSPWRAEWLRTVRLDFIGRTRWEVAKASLDDPMWRAHKADLDARRPFRDFIYTLAGPGGQQYHFAVGGRPLFDRDGRFAGYRGSAADITRQREAEREREHVTGLLRATVERLRRFVDSCLDVVCVTDMDGRFIEVSPRCLEVWGYAPEELIGRPFADFMHPEDREATLAERRKIMATEQRGQVENRYLHKNGAIVHMHWSVVWSETDAVVFSIARDVTARHEAEQRLRHAQRIEAIGQLTGGVAHDFNNLLTVILGNAELLADVLQDCDDLRPLAEMIGTAAARGADLTGGLLAFARRQALQPQHVDVAALLQRLTDMLHRLLGERIRIDVAPMPDLWPTRVDPAQLETAIVNLAINARDAMPGGGVLVIEAGNVVVGPERAEGVPPGEWVLLQIADTGTGMSEAVASRAFEPFFTTKEVGQGSGLGLSMVHGFVRQSGGHVQIESRVGKGTIVRLFLARSASTAAASGPPSEPEPVPRGTEHILLVEDDAFVRAHAEAALRSLGYRITIATNGLDALALIESGRSFDLLFTDVVMPGGMDGIALARAVRRLRPGLTVLLTTGYAGNFSAMDEDDLFHNLLPKPYRRQQLAVRVRAALDRA